MEVKTVIDKEGAVTLMSQDMWFGHCLCLFVFRHDYVVSCFILTCLVSSLSQSGHV